MKKPVHLVRRAIFKKYLHAAFYTSKYQRKSSEIPKSTKAKNTAITITVASTTTVYLVSSFFLGQLTFLISDITFLKNPPTLAILAKPPHGKSIFTYILITFVYVEYARYNAYNTFFVLYV